MPCRGKKTFTVSPISFVTSIDEPFGGVASDLSSCEVTSELALLIVPQCSHFARSVVTLMLSLSSARLQLGQFSSVVIFVCFRVRSF